MIVHDDPAVDGKTALLRESHLGADSHTHNDDLTIDASVLEDHALGVDLLGRFAEMELNPFLLMQLAHKYAQFRTEDTLEWHQFPTNHVHLKPSRGQRRRRFEADERRADHDGAPLRMGDDRSAVIQRTEQVGSRSARNIKTDRRRSSRQ